MKKFLQEMGKLQSFAMGLAKEVVKILSLGFKGPTVATPAAHAVLDFGTQGDVHFGIEVVAGSESSAKGEARVVADFKFVCGITARGGVAETHEKFRRDVEAVGLGICLRGLAKQDAEHGGKHDSEKSAFHPETP